MAIFYCLIWDSPKSKSKVKVYYDWQSVGQSVQVSCTHLGPATNFSHSLFDYFFDSFRFVDVGRPLWQGVGSVVYSFWRASPAQPPQEQGSQIIPSSILLPKRPELCAGRHRGTPLLHGYSTAVNTVGVFPKTVSDGAFTGSSSVVLGSWLPWKFNQRAVAQQRVPTVVSYLWNNLGQRLHPINNNSSPAHS
jgi:hypothetical protein